MSTDGEVMMPVGSAEAWRQAQVLAMRQLGDLVGAQTRRLDEMTAVITDMRDRVIRMEAQDPQKSLDVLRGELAAMRVRVDELESQRDRFHGVAAFTSWLSKVAPWFLAMCAAIWAGRETISK